MSALVEAPSGLASHVSPFVGLAPFEASQAAFFFGRERDTRLIASNLLAFRLTILYGPSGVGKSSILEAGVVPEVLRRARSNTLGDPPLVVYINSWRDDPTLVLDHAVRDAADRAGLIVPGEASPSGTLRGRLEAWAAGFGNALYLVFDQFEDFFLYHDAGSAATANLGDALAADIPLAHVLLSLREDALAKLDRFQDRLPNILDNTYRLSHLDREGAAAAITGPIGVLNELSPADLPWRLEDGLVDDVLDQVRVGGVVIGATGKGQVTETADSDAYETAHLQLVMNRLWEAERSNWDHEVRIATLAALGGADGIVRSHLSETLKDLSGRERQLAAGMFVHLVTPSGTKIAHGVDDLADYAGSTRDGVSVVLEKLASGGRRILRPVPPSPDRPGVDRYEIFHDALGEAISEWRQRHEASQQVRRERRRHLLVSSIAVVLAGLLALAIVLFLRSQAQTRDARSARLAAEALSELGEDPVNAGRLALEAWDEAHTQAAEDSIRQVAGSLMVDRALTGHTGPITSTEVSPDGATVLTTSEDGTARLWPINGGTPVRLEGHRLSLTRGRFSPNGTRVATISDDNTLRIWDARGGGLERVIEGPEVGFWDIRFSSDEVVIATGVDGTHFYDLELENDHEITEESAFAIAITSEGQLAVGNNDGTVVIADPRTAERLAEFDAAELFEPPSPTSITAVATHPATGDVAFGDIGGNVWFWRWGTDVPPTFVGSGDIPLESVLTLEFSPDGSRLLAAIEKVGVLFDVPAADTDEVDQPIVIAGANDWVGAATFSPDGRLAVLASQGVGFVSDGETGASIAELRGHSGLITGVAIAADDRIVTGSLDGTARVWRLPGHTLLRGSTDWVVDVDVDEDAGVVVAVGRDGRVLGWTLEDAELTMQIDDDGVDDDLYLGALNTVALSPDGQNVAAGGDAWKIWIWDRQDAVSKSDVIEPFMRETPSSVVNMSFNGSDQLIFGLATGEVFLWSWREEDAPLTRLAKHSSFALVAPSPDGKLLATGGADGAVWIWNLATRERVLELQAHDGEVRDLAFSPDNEHLVTAGGDRAARVWDLETGRMEHELRGHDVPLSAVAFSADGARVATGAADGTVGVWVADTGRYLFLAGVHDDFTNAVQFLDDGRVLSAGDDNLIRVVTCGSCGPIDDVVEQVAARLAAVPPRTRLTQPTTIRNAEIVAGTCLPTMGEESFTHVTPVPCDVAHATEVYAVIQLPDGAAVEYDPEIFVRADGLCRSGYFNQYVGIPADDSRYETFASPPTPESWDAGLRRVYCQLEHPSGRSIGSARNTRE